MLSGSSMPVLLTCEFWFLFVVVVLLFRTLLVQGLQLSLLSCLWSIC